ncbi:MAG: hypothetical protein GXO75_04930 [Calditrichaeota bacterium]|nr:hypothetical protein [Calditrichota bacterium]
MRKIKFRGKRKDDGKWIYGDLIHYDANEYYILEQYQRDWDILEVGLKVTPKTVGQFIGLYDKNGKEIYEGDILQFKTQSGWKVEPVKIEDGLLYPIFDPQYVDDEKGDWIESDFEVIGNIHDNPELLKK